MAFNLILSGNNIKRNIIIENNKGYEIVESVFTNKKYRKESFQLLTFKEIAKLFPEKLELRHTCLCGKYLDESDRDKDYKLPNNKSYCKTCKESLEWIVKEV